MTADVRAAIGRLREVEAQALTYVSAIRGENELRVGVSMCALLLDEIADALPALLDVVSAAARWKVVTDDSDANGRLVGAAEDALVAALARFAASMEEKP